MMNINEKITPLGFIMLFTSHVIGMGIVKVGGDLAAIVATDGIIFLLIGLASGLIGVWLSTSLSGFFPEKTFVEYVPLILGKYLGFIYILIFFIYYFSWIPLILRLFVDGALIVLLPNTPVIMISLLMLAAVVYQVLQTFDSLMKIIMIFNPLIIFVIILIFCFSIFKGQFMNLMPVLTNNPQVFIKNAPFAVLYFLGYEFLYLIMPFLQKKERALKDSMIAVFIIFILLSMMYMAPLLLLGTQITSQQVLSAFTLVRVLEIGKIRLEILLIAIWILAVFRIMSIYLFISTLIISRYFGLKNRIILTLSLGIIIYIAVSIPQNQNQINSWINIWTYLGILLHFGITPLLLTIAKLKTAAK